MNLRHWLRRKPPPALILLSNREPFVHDRGPGGELRVTSPVGGLTSALQPVMAQHGGTWVAWGSGPADFEAAGPDDSVAVPPERPVYRLRRIRLTDAERQGYYVDSANRTLWPLCHSHLHHFVFDPGAWKIYRRVNERFAVAALAEAAGGTATIWVHDYHLACVAGVLRRVPGLLVHQFWHIPWPPPEILRVLPTARGLLRALLGNDLLVFQTSRDQINFMTGVVDLLPESTVNVRRSTVRLGSHLTTVRVHPISIDVGAFERAAARADVQQVARGLRRQYLPHGGQLILAVDRVDYTKGILHRLDAFSHLLRKYPDLKQRVTLLQIAVPTRQEIPDYQALEQEVAQAATRLNRRFGDFGWKPVHLVRESYDAVHLTACYRAADVCVVSSLQDGMNLVAKEFVACQRDGLGVLVLSRFAGASEEMDGAILINPYDTAATAAALYTALAMKPREREFRMETMRRRLRAHTIYDWMEDIFADVVSLGRVR